MLWKRAHPPPARWSRCRTGQRFADLLTDSVFFWKSQKWIFTHELRAPKKSWSEPSFLEVLGDFIFFVPKIPINFQKFPKIFEKKAGGTHNTHVSSQMRIWSFEKNQFFFEIFKFLFAGLGVLWVSKPCSWKFSESSKNLESFQTIGVFIRWDLAETFGLEFPHTLFCFPSFGPVTT